MKGAKFDVTQALRDIEDRLAPRLGMNPPERAVYYHLLRHTRLEGRAQRLCSVGWLGAGAGISTWGARKVVRTLAEKGALQILERSRKGHLVRVRLPEEIAGCGSRGANAAPTVDLEELDFLREPALREAIYRREAGRCFYCQRRLNARIRAIDHVFPRADLPCPNGTKRNLNSYRNLVSCCTECNSQKGRRPAADFLRGLYREGRLSSGELADRLAALKALVEGRMKPQPSAKKEGGQMHAEQGTTDATADKRRCTQIVQNP